MFPSPLGTFLYLVYIQDKENESNTLLKTRKKAKISNKIFPWVDLELQQNYQGGFDLAR